MKKMISIVLTLALVGCVGRSNYTQLLIQSTQDGEPEPQALLVKNHIQEITPDLLIEEELKNELMMDQSRMSSSLPINDFSKQIKEVYTIQVLALSNNKGFYNYMKKLPKKRAAWTNKKKVNGVSWYTLLYGKFDSLDHAECVLNALPYEIKKQGPFIQSFNKIQSSMYPEVKRLKPVPLSS